MNRNLLGEKYLLCAPKERSQPTTVRAYSEGAIPQTY